MYTFLNGSMRVRIDENHGWVREINDGELNWITDTSDWGRIRGFANVRSARELPNGVTFTYSHDSRPLCAEVTRTLTDREFIEEYHIRNEGAIDYFMRDGEFGIYFPIRCAVRRAYRSLNDDGAAVDEGACAEDPHAFLRQAANAHVWCGGEIAYINAVRIDGAQRWLSVYLEQGDIRDYEISRDVCVTNNGADYRGDVVLIPQPRHIGVGQELVLRFAIRFEECGREEALLAHPGHIALSADNYAAVAGEPVHLSARYNGEIKSAGVTMGEAPVEFAQNGNVLEWTDCAEQPGERTYRVSINGKRTWIRINRIEPVEEILRKRAEFIAKKQQCLDESSPLYGAYLIYDRAAESQYFDQAFPDHNAGRERIAMAVMLALRLQRSPDPTLRRSLDAYIPFMEKNFLDRTTGIVYNEMGRNNDNHRLYNYPWFSVFYVEMYNLTGDDAYLQCAEKILEQYYANGGKRDDSQCIPAFELIEILRKNGQEARAERIKQLLLLHVEDILDREMVSHSLEIGYAPEMPLSAATYLAQAYVLTGDSKYLPLMMREWKSAESFIDNQPDFHMNHISLRHFDGYWFGKRMRYGDLYPQYWSSLTGEMYYWLDRALHRPELYRKACDIFRENLCVYAPDGFASASYFYPRRVETYRSDPAKINRFLPVGETYGKWYDDWANDQDWALYFAMKRL